MKDRQGEIGRVTKILEDIGLMFAQSVATQLVDRGVGTKDRFEVEKQNPHKRVYRYVVKAKDYKEDDNET